MSAVRLEKPPCRELSIPKHRRLGGDRLVAVITTLLRVFWVHLEIHPRGGEGLGLLALVLVLVLVLVLCPLSTSLLDHCVRVHCKYHSNPLISPLPF